MKTLTTCSALTGLLVLFLFTGTALAQDPITFKPECGAPGDPVFISGSGFGTDPVVWIDAVDAEVLRSDDSRILCEVPEGATLGAVDITVDGTLADGDFTVLEEGAPVIYRVSAEKVRPGTPIVLIGRRLGGGEARFLDSTGATAATVDPRGRRRAIMVKVPDDLDPGDYTLEIENADGLDTGTCSPSIEVVLAGTPGITAVEPEDSLPGDPIEITGSDLSPPGPCKVIFTDASGNDLQAFGFSNGYDEIFTHVPFRAEGGATYDVSVELRGAGSATGSIVYVVGSPGSPEIDDVIPDTAPAGGVFRILGTGLVSYGSKPVAELNDGTNTIRLKLLGALPGMKGRFGPMGGNAPSGGPGRPDFTKDELLVQIPQGTADGDYDLTVTVGTETTDAADFTVGLADLTVTSMWPSTQSGRFIKPMIIEGTGFGFKGVVRIEVTFDDGSGGVRPKGNILFQMDDVLMVAPPGGFRTPLATGTYDVWVTRDPGGAAESVMAGVYTVR